MKSLGKRFRLLGVDLLPPYRCWRDGWREALQAPFLSRLVPRAEVRVLAPGSAASSYRAGTTAASAPESRFAAVVLPDELVLYREMTLPAQDRAPLEQAVALEVSAINPFGPDFAWGWIALPHVGEQPRRVRVALAARKHVARYLASLNEGLAADHPEIWAGGTPPIILRGYGERRRLEHERMLRRAAGALLVGAVTLALAVAALPVYVKQQRAAHAQLLLAELRAEVAGVLDARDALERSSQHARALTAHVASRPEVLSLLDRLSELLPDTTHLVRLEISPERVSLTGKSADATQLMTILGAEPTFRAVRAPNTIALDPATGTENFTIEFAPAPRGRTP